jgi:hypothetical protein
VQAAAAVVVATISVVPVAASVPPVVRPVVVMMASVEPLVVTGLTGLHGPALTMGMARAARTAANTFVEGIA